MLTHLTKLAALRPMSRDRRPTVGDSRSPVGDWGTTVDFIRALAPMAAPLLLVVCAPRWEMLAVALVWMLFMVPGWLLGNLLFDSAHPLGRVVSRPAVASVLALFLFGVPSWIGCMVHTSLTTLMVVFAGIYVATVAVCARRLLRRDTPGMPGAEKGGAASAKGGAASAHVGEAADAALAEGCCGFDLPRPVAAVLTLLLIGVLVAVVYASPPPSIELNAKSGKWASNNARYQESSRPDWWHAPMAGAVVAVLAGGLLWWGDRRRITVQPNADASGPGSSAGVQAAAAGRTPRRGRSPRSGRWIDWDRWLPVLLWVGCAAGTMYIMQWTYSVAVPETPMLKQGWLPWNVDDVAYVSEAVDYRYGYPLGAYEPSVGGEFPMSRTGMSPLFAPLVAMISRVTNIPCAALHHSVMPPLIVLLGVSAFAAAFNLLFRGHRWAVPLALLVSLVMVYKSWDYARCLVEMLAMRAMQPKAVHLWLLEPLQLASVILLVRSVRRADLGFGALVAVVGHLTHPLATIVGMVWTSTATGVLLVQRRKAAVQMALLLVLYCGLGGLFYVTSRVSRAPGPRLNSGRKAGDLLQSRDVIRADTFVFQLAGKFTAELEESTPSRALLEAFSEHDQKLSPRAPVAPDDDGGWTLGAAPQGFRVRPSADGASLDVYRIAAEPRFQHDPYFSFGLNTLYLLSVLAIPLLIACGRSNPALAYVGLLSLAVVLACQFELLGNLLGKALPMSIFWRARWIVPQLINVGVLGVVLFGAMYTRLPRRADGGPPAMRLLAALGAVAAFAVMVQFTSSQRLRMGPAPEDLTKFSKDVPELVDLLGGVESAPFVWATFLPHHELPQLMPNIKLVMSRDKFMRPADDEQFRNIVLGVFSGYSRGMFNPYQFDRLLELYPIDHVVVDYRYRPAAQLAEHLKSRGWRRVGRTRERIYEVWRIPQDAQP